MRIIKSFFCFSLFLFSLIVIGASCFAANENIPAAVGTTITGEDGSLWEQVNVPGFGNSGNKGIVVLHEYQGRLYAVTRNDETGFEIWRTNGTGWEQISVPGLTDRNIYYCYVKPGLLAAKYDTKYNVRNNQWGDMIEFNGNLYLAISTGYQGAQLYGAIGAEIWRYDGTTWEPVMGEAVDTDESGSITAISGCAAGDGAPTAQITDGSKSWATNQWAGCVLRVDGAFTGANGTDAGVVGMRVFDIISNTADTLTVQQNEKAGYDEDTVCTEFRVRLPADYGHPDNVVAAIGNGDS